MQLAEEVCKRDTKNTAPEQKSGLCSDLSMLDAISFHPIASQIRIFMASTHFNSIPDSLRLSPTTSYSIRKLLLKHLDRLKFVISASGTGRQADPWTDLNAVVESLYVETKTIHAVVQELEQLASCHQALLSRESQYSQELERIQRKIFGLLGFRLSSGES